LAPAQYSPPPPLPLPLHVLVRARRAFIQLEEETTISDDDQGWVDMWSTIDVSSSAKEE
jgi:hypothetical protein